MKQVLIIGGGPAGMITAIMVAGSGRKVSLFEQNRKLGKKLYITGKGRCNITNASSVESLLEHMVTNKKFMYSSFYGFTSEQTIDFFNGLGLATKVERGNRVFPISNKASDVIDALESKCRSLGIAIYLNTKVTGIKVTDEKIEGIYVGDVVHEGTCVVVATGGQSYASTGSTGDGYDFAKATGHKVVTPTQGLVPLNVREAWIPLLQGLSLKNIELKIESEGRTIYQGFGEILFTHFGISGPLVIRASSYMKKVKWPIKGWIDLKPRLDEEQLDRRLVRDFIKYSRKNFANALSDLLPKKMIPIIIQLSGILPSKKVDQLTKAERLKLVKVLKNLPLTLIGKRNFNEAVITQGGVHVKAINPNTMASKKVSGLYFVGEVIDIDALTGGYNLQIAFSTGYLAAMAIIENQERRFR